MVNWLNENSNRDFPFLAGSVNRTSAGADVGDLPDYAIADARFTVLSPAYGAATHKIWLAQAARNGAEIALTFASDASLTPLVVTVPAAAPDYAIIFIENADWSVLLTIGRVSQLFAWLADETTLERVDSTAAIIEPGCVQAVGNSVVNSINIANIDRTRWRANAGCESSSESEGAAAVHVVGLGLVGDLDFVPGYNCAFRLGPAGIAVIPEVGAGAGVPCGPPGPDNDRPEPPVFDGESLTERGTYDGAIQCNAVVRSINGAHGPDAAIVGGAGVTVQTDAQTSTITVAADLSGFAACS